MQRVVGQDVSKGPDFKIFSKMSQNILFLIPTFFFQVNFLIKPFKNLFSNFREKSFRSTKKRKKILPPFIDILADDSFAIKPFSQFFTKS
jgi:hypothetical protein